MPSEGPATRTDYPVTTGGSVVALKYAGGVLVATDCLVSYGTLARFEGVTRMATVGLGNDTLLAAGGEYSDYQQMLKMIEHKTNEEYAIDDGASISPSALHHWLTRVLYQRRSKMDPLWNRCAARPSTLYRPPADQPGSRPAPACPIRPARLALARSIVVAGFRHGKAYLGTSDLYGTMYEDDFVVRWSSLHAHYPPHRPSFAASMLPGP